MQNKQEQNSSRSANEVEKLTCLSTAEMKAICGVLRSFKNVMMAVEGDNVTLHNYWPTLCEMKRVLVPNRGDINLEKDMKTAGLRYIDRVESAGSFKLSLRHKLAVFLHPQMKGLSFASSDERRY